MLHHLAYSTFRNIIEVGNKYAFHCFQWNARGDVIEVTTDQGKLRRWRILGTIQIFYCIFIYARLYESVVINGIPIEKCTVHATFVAAYSFYASTTINSFRKREEIAEFFTNFFQTDNLFKPLKHQQSKSKEFGKFVRLLYILCINTGVLHAPLFLALPRNANFIFSILSPHLLQFKLLYPILEVCFAIFEMLMGLAAWSAAAAIYSIAFCVVANSLPLWAEVMKYDVTWRATPIPRQRYYRIVQLLMTQFNDCFGYDSFLTITTLSYFGTVLCAFATLRYYGKIPFLAYVVFPTAATLIALYVFLVYPKAGKAADSHTKMVRQWRYIESHIKTKLLQGDGGEGTTITRSQNWGLIVSTQVFNKRKYNLAFIRSCRQVGFQVGPLFTVKPGTTLNYCDMVIDQLINCLISF